MKNSFLFSVRSRRARCFSRFASGAVAVLLLVALLSSFASAAGEEPLVVDNASLFTASELNGVSDAVSDFIAATGYDAVVLTSESAGINASLSFADDFYDTHDYGFDDEFSGFVYFIDMKNRVPTISTCGVMIDIITDNRLDALLEKSFEYLENGDYAGSAVAVMTLAKAYALEGIPDDGHRYDDDDPYHNDDDYYYEDLPFWETHGVTGMEWFVSFAIALVVAIIINVSTKSAYSLKGSTYRYDTGKNVTVTMTGATDNYIRSTVRRVPRNNNSSGGGFSGGSSGGSGSRTHTSSSGRSHGGGSGRRF